LLALHRLFGHANFAAPWWLIVVCKDGRSLGRAVNVSKALRVNSIRRNCLPQLTTRESSLRRTDDMHRLPWRIHACPISGFRALPDTDSSARLMDQQPPRRRLWTGSGACGVVVEGRDG